MDSETIIARAPLQIADILIICVYIGIVLSIGIWSSFKARGGGVSGYFLAGRKMNWFLVGSSLFGSNIGSEHFVGLAGSGAAAGIGIAGFELNAMFILMILGWVFLPIYISSGIYTMPEYIKKRFGGTRIRVYLASVALLLSIFTKISADLFAGSILIKTALGWNLYASIALLLAVSCISTVAGGLRAVMWTDTIQVLIMVSGAIVLMSISFHKVGGYSQLVEKYFFAIPSANFTYPNVSACAGIPSPESMNLLRSIDNKELPWLGTTLGLSINAVWYWCADQVIVQKALSSKNYSHAKGGCILAALYKFLPLWLIVFPGMIARVLYPNEIACTNPSICERICYSQSGCTNVAYPLLVTRLLPTGNFLGLRGIMVAVLMSAIVNSVSSIFNSSSTIFTMDIWKTARKRASSLELLIVGRLFVVFMVSIAVLWIPVIAAFPNSQLFVYVQSVTSYLAPPVCATFVLAVLVPRVNEKGAFYGLMVGLVIGLTRFVLEASYPSPKCYTEDMRPIILSKVNYLHFGIFLFAVVCSVILVISYLTPPIDKKHLVRLTFWSRFSEDDRINLEEIERSESPPVSAEIPGAEKNSKFASFVRRLYFVCGIKKDSPDEGSAFSPEDKISLKEKKFWRLATNISMICIVSFGIFIYCFWA